MNVSIQFLRGIYETTLPSIFLTKSQNGKTGTATFFFQNPSLFSEYNNSLYNIEHMLLIWENKEIETKHIKIHFYNGKPKIIEGLFIFTSEIEWFQFFSFMRQYSKETGLFYQEKKK